MGQALGGPWTFIGPAAGFGIGLVGDMKMMKHFHKKAGPQQSETELRAKADADPEAPNQGAASAPAAQSGAGCGIASGLMRVFGMNEGKKQGEMTLAEIRRTYQTDSSAQPPAAETMANAQPAAVEKAKSA
ncbi:MAG: hypothetical protein ACREQZ_04155 [Woeseiaceae bacterium]